MSTTGETTFTTRGRNTAKQEFKLLPNGEYELKLMGSAAEVKCKPEPGSVPYVQCTFQVTGSNRKIYHLFFLTLRPGKNGQAMIDREDQLLGLRDVLGVDADFSIETVQAKDKMTGELEPAQILNGKQFADWLKGLDGTLVKAFIKTEPAMGGYPAKNKIGRFIPATTNNSADTSALFDND